MVTMPHVIGASVSGTTEFVSGLVLAANKLGKQTPFERKRLLDNAILIIIDMREIIGIPVSRTTRDALTSLRAASDAVTLGYASDGQVKAALLDAASMIRDLHIVLDTETEIQIEGGG
jgi:hypothetical protein